MKENNNNKENPKPKNPTTNPSQHRNCHLNKSNFIADKHRLVSVQGVAGTKNTTPEAVC